MCLATLDRLPGYSLFFSVMSLPSGGHCHSDVSEVGEWGQFSES